MTGQALQQRELPKSVVECNECNDCRECDAHPGRNVACMQCLRTGMFVTGTLNGKPVGPGGRCFRCQGKGYHTWMDRQRNENYERFGRRY